MINKINNSDIFNEYASLALKRGIIKNAGSTDAPPKHDDELSAIEILYGVKPNGEKDDILDQAHPESVIIAPAYDRLNGLVENLKERHNVMCDIALKPTNGKLTQRRYVKANQDLIQELTKIAFMLDRKGETELMTLADSCTERLVLKKEAFFPALFSLGGLALYGGIVALLGLFAANHSAAIGVKQNATKALEKIQSLIDSGDIPGIENKLARLVKALHKLIEASEMVESIQTSSADLPSLKDVSIDNISEHKDVAKDNLTELYKQNAFKVLAYYAKLCQFVQRLIPSVINVINLRAEQTVPAESSFMYWGGKILNFFYQDKYEDVTDELTALDEAITENVKLLSLNKQVLSSFSKEQETMQQFNKAFDELAVERAKLNTKTNTSPASEPIETKSLEDELDLLKL